MSDEVEDLNGGYQFVHEGGTDNFVLGSNMVPPNVTSFVQSNEFIIFKQQTAIKDCIDFYSFSFYGIYVNYSESIKKSSGIHNSSMRLPFIADSTIYNIYFSCGVSLSNSSEDIIKSNRIADSILRYNPVYSKIFRYDTLYWLITLADGKLHGPWNDDEYIQKRKEFNIPKNMILK